MRTLKTTLTRSALDVLYYTAAYRAIEPFARGVGIIFTLHHVRTAVDQAAFSPNRILEVSTDFLDRTLQQVKAHGCDIISLDEAHRRMIDADFRNRFVCFTLDDGYADNYVNALPVFAKHDAPFTVYVTTGLPDGDAVLWWRHLEDIVRSKDEVVVRFGQRTMRFRATTLNDMSRAFQEIYWALRQLPHEQQCRVIGDLIEDNEIDATALCRRYSMTWDMIRDLGDCGLASIGAHTLNHYSMSKLDSSVMRAEAEMSRRKIAEVTGREPNHFAYPFGDSSSAGRREFEAMSELGFRTATTTRKGVIFPQHANHLHALPRVSLNGDYQSAHYVRLFLSGVPFALARQFRRLDIN